MTEKITFNKGDKVRIKPGGELGTFVIMRAEPNDDGSFECYGGDADPGGYRKSRSLAGDKLMLENRKDTLKRVARADVK